jgi:hypothetical protein
MFLEISWGLRAGNWAAGRQTRLWQAKKAFDLAASWIKQCSIWQAIAIGLSPL